MRKNIFLQKRKIEKEMRIWNSSEKEGERNADACSNPVSEARRRKTVM